MNVFVTGLSFKTAPVELRERLAIGSSTVRCFSCRLKLREGLQELVLLSTCNRVEIYGVAPDGGVEPQKLFRHLVREDVDLEPYLYHHEGEKTLHHLFSVAGGLDSMVLGETEITGQLKQAYQAAHESKHTGRVLNRAFQTALQTAKEIRTTTQVGRGAISVGSMAVELAEKIFGGDLSDKSVMIVGSGKMGEACLRHLSKKGNRSVLVANRSFDRAESLAGLFGGRAVRYESLLNAMTEADIVVSSTGCQQPILNAEHIKKVMAERRDRPLFLIDIGVPRNIHSDVEPLDGVYLYNIDHLATLVQENVKLREQELGRCQEIIAKRAGQVMAHFAPRTEQGLRTSRVSRPEFASLQPAFCGS